LGVLKNGFHDRLLIFLLRPFFQIFALLATLTENGARSQPLRDGVPFVQDARNTKSAAQLVYSHINALTAKTDLSLVRLRPYLSLVLAGRG
jgi:hypothetical protein